MAGPRSDLVATLRQRLADTQPNVAAFSLAVTGNAKGALLESANGHLSVTVEGGENVSSIRVPLGHPSYNTVGKLIDFLSRQRGYAVIPAEGYDAEHPSIDLRVDGLPDIANGSSYTLKHRVFSDAELLDLLSAATQLHNPNYTIASVPHNEREYVLLSAAASAYRMLAASAAKRQGLEGEAATYLSLASDLERQYEESRRRLERIIPVPKADESKIGTGDVIVGTLTRRSLRVNYIAPRVGATPPTPPTLYDPSDDDVEDTVIRLRWSQNRDTTFSHYELWRDTQPNVERSVAGRLQLAEGVAARSTPYSKAGTAKQVLGVQNSAGRQSVSPIFDGAFFWTAAELAGSAVVNSSFVDGIVLTNPHSGETVGEPLEPEFDYYYRLYAINMNGEVVPSNVVRVRTRPMRARFLWGSNGMLADDAMSARSGTISGGDEVVIKGTNLSTSTTVTIGGKQCRVLAASASEMTIKTPAFANMSFIGKPMDVVLISPTGLKDIAIAAWRYT